MAKKKSSDDVAVQVAEFIGKAIGGLVNRKEALQRELATVERQIASLRDGVMRQFGAVTTLVKKGKAKVAPAKAAKATKPKSSKRVLTPETRAKMAEAAKRRWAKAKKAGKNSLA